MKFEVGDIVYFTHSPKNIFIIEEVRNDGWIWSSKLKDPFYNNGGITMKNYRHAYLKHSLLAFDIQYLRNKKINELGI